MNSIAVVGAGLSGVSLASLIKNRFEVKIFEKSRGVGGRMSTRKEHPYVFDHGAQYFKIKNEDFMNFVSELFYKKIIRPWNFRCAYFEKNTLKKIRFFEEKDNFFVGTPNMDSIVKHLSKNCNVLLNTKIVKIMRKKKKWYLFDENNNTYGSYDWVILSLPAQQSFKLLDRHSPICSFVKPIKMKGCFSLMIGMNKSLDLNFDSAIVQKKDISWLAINNSKPLRKNKFSLLVNSCFDYASNNINTPKNLVLNHMLNETSMLIKKKFDINMIKLHHWMYVEAENPPRENFFIDHDKKIAVCGDWFINSRVEGAFLSANELSKKIIL